MNRELQIAVLMTCHNRKELTLRCFRSLANNCADGASRSDFSIDVWLNDDGCTDETGKAVCELDRELTLTYKNFHVYVVKGSGNDYWARGMERSWQSAMKHREYDAFLWLNDDVVLKPGAIGGLIADSGIGTQTTAGSVVIGACSTDASERESSYSATDPRDIQIFPNGIPQLADGWFNGNCVFIPKAISEKVGLIDGAYSHARADYDYAERLKRVHVPFFCSSHFVGVCVNGKRPRGLWERLRALVRPSDCNLKDLWRYRRRYYGLCRALVSCLHLIWMQTRELIIGAGFILLCGAFMAYALKFQTGLAGVREFMGWDYATYVEQFRDWRWIGYFGFRHPGLGLVCAPIVALEHLYEGAYLLVMPLIAAVTAWLLWRMSGWIGIGVWLCFPTTWYMAAIPESFPIAQLMLVASVWVIVSHGGHAGRVTLPFWAVVNGMVTLTNGIKPILVWLVNKGTWQKKLRLLAITGGVALTMVGLFYARSLVTGRSCWTGVALTLNWIPNERHFLTEAYGFFIRPVGLWQSLVVYPLLAWSIGRMVARRDFGLLRILGPMFAVDLVIHWIVGWGMSEPWVFAPHWVWMVPLCIGRSFRRCA